MISVKRASELVNEIWPAAVSKGWLPPVVMAGLCDELSRFQLDDEQIKNAMISHALNDNATNKPRTEKLISRLKEIRRAEVSATKGSTDSPGASGDWIEAERYEQSKTNPQANQQPAWRIMAAWFDAETQATRRENARQAKPHPENRIMDAGRSMASILQMYGAGYNDAVYSACAILGCDPVELDKDIQDHLLISREARLVSQKKISRMIAGAV